MLKLGDTLLSKDMITKPITHKSFVPKPLKIYMLEVEDLHTFFVGKGSILTHNIFLPIAANLGLSIPFGSVATSTAGSFFGPIGMVGGFVLGGVISIAIKAIYENHIHRYKTPKYNIDWIASYCNTIDIDHENNVPIQPAGCFIPNSAENIIYAHTIPIEYPLPQTPVGCIEIGLHNHKNEIIHSYDKHNEAQNIKNEGCFEPSEQNEKIIFNKQEKTTESENVKTRYQGEKARNWDEFGKDCFIGQKYGKKFIHTGKYNPKDGSPIRKLIENIPDTEMFKKGYHFALDRFHEGDHFEVWDKNGKWIGVANLDGSKNEKKTNAEKDKNSRHLPK